MAQKVMVTLVDDLDGSEAEETVEFGLDGAFYEIDLSEDNAERLRDALSEYVEHARRQAGARRRVAARIGPDVRRVPPPRIVNRTRQFVSGPVSRG